MFKDEEAVSPVIGVVLMVAITVVLAAGVFLIVGQFSDVDAKAPDIGFTREGDSLIVHYVDSGHEWGNFTVLGCDKPTGTVSPGDTLTGCSGTVLVSHNPSGQLVWRGKFA